MQTTILLYNSFSNLIQNTLNSQPDPFGVDLSKEARYLFYLLIDVCTRMQKCKQCYSCFVEMKQIAESKYALRLDALGDTARRLVKLIQ